MATQYAFGKIVTDGLVLALDAADTNSYPGSGTAWIDLSPNLNSMTILGSPTFSSDNPKFFNFTSNQITKYTILNPFSIPIDDITSECWVRFGSTTLTGALISYATVGNNNAFLLFFSVGTLQFYGPSTLAGTSWSIPDTTSWYQIVRTRIKISGLETLYINGSQIQSFTLDANISNTSGGALVLAQEQDSVAGTFDPGQCFIGDINSTRIYNRALSAPEVLQNYNAQKSRFGLT